MPENLTQSQQLSWTKTASGTLTTPVLFLIFNRPETEQRVFEEIRKAQPARLFVSADGPRPGRPGEAERCEAAREIVRWVDWDCEVRTNFRDDNVGLKLAVSSGVDWLFEHVDEGIILEDDCLPSQSFFRFCQELLARYRDDQRIMQISGSNYLAGNKVTEYSYYFSRLNDIWGWATWKRAWRHMDLSMRTFPRFKEQRQLENYIDDPATRSWLMSYFEDAFGDAGHRGLWSSQWAYAIASQNGLTAVPSVNLVANIGLTAGATHYADSFDFYSTVGRSELGELAHPQFILPNKRADALRFDVIRKTDPRLAWRARIKRLAAKHLPGSVRALLHNLLASAGRR